VVVLRNVATQKEYQSEPTDPDGLYRIPGIEEGRYVMGVKAASGSYNFHYSLLIKSDALAKLSVAMKPGGDPVMLQQGYDANKKKSIGDFFKSPAGIVTILAAVGTLFALVWLRTRPRPSSIEPSGTSGACLGVDRSSTQVNRDVKNEEGVS
jgi:hypothetical protein